VNHPLLVFAVGILGGAAGALGVGLLADRHGPTAPVAATAGRGTEDILARLERLERTGLRVEPPAPVLEGSGAAAAGEAAPDGDAVLVARIAPRIEEVVEKKLQAIEEAREAEQEAAKKQQEARRRPLTLAEAAQQVGLTAREEDAVRQIYQDAETRALGLLAAPDGDVEQVRRDIAEAVRDESARPKVIQKYMPKAMTKLGDFMAVEMEKEARIQEAVGPEKAERLGDLDVVEGRFMGLGELTVGAEMRAR